jgi:hypothetical protein
MITKPTVFILGAGASKPYGFPLGLELREIICDLTYNRAAHYEWVRNLTTHSNFTNDQIEEFRSVFTGSQTASIDSFLSRHSVQYGAIGKAIIASIIIGFEKSQLFASHNISDNWYFNLWNTMQSGAHAIDDLSQNNVKFITFNYDRTLEFFLYTACKNTFAIEPDIALSAIKKFPILHLYGSLGNFNFVDQDNAREFSAELSPIKLALASAALKVIPEARDDDIQFKQARNWLREAESICFLGFGFDPINCKRLNLFNILEAKIEQGLSIPRVVASMLGKTAPEVQLASSLTCRSNMWETFFLENNMTLRQSGILN